ncbi:TonB-dependent siderophore receptor [Zobellella denitrificans]
MRRQRAFTPSLLALAVSSALSGQALAQSGTDDAPLLTEDTVVVQGKAYRHTATKSALAPEETPQGISVVDRETLDQRGVDSVAEALRYVPGVHTELRGGAVSRLDLFNIRGFINYQNFYDGLPLTYNDWNLQPQIDAFAIEQVEVFKGPTSVLYGAMPPGGMVNLIARQPSSQPFNELTLAGGSHDLREGTFESRGALKDDGSLNYSLVALGRKKDGQAETSEEERYLIAPSVDWHISDRTLLNLNLYYQHDPSAGIFNTLPAAGLFKDNVNGRLPADAYSGDANWNTYDREVLLVGYKLNHELNDDWTLLQNLRFMDATAYQENSYGAGLDADQRTLARRAYLTDEASRSWAIDNQLSGRIQTGSLEHNLLLGVDYTWLNSDIRYEDGAMPAIDLFARNHRLFRPADFSADFSADFRRSTRQTGFYLQDQIRLDRLVLIAGGRYDRYVGNEKGMQYGAQVDSTVEQNKFSFRAGALYELPGGFSPFVSYAEGFEPITGHDRHGNTFKPTTSQQWETGVKYQSADRRHQGTLSAFHITKENDPTRDPNGSAYDKIQTGEVVAKGLELEAGSYLTDNLSLAASLTLMDMEVTRDNSGLAGKTPIWVPERQASLWANYDIFDGALAGTTLGAGVRYVGKTQMDAFNTDQVPAYTLVDLALGYDLGRLNGDWDGARVQLSANNLFDKRYYSCFDESNCWFGAERELKASLSYRF